MNQKFKPEISTGGYGDRRFQDEWFWAATELYVTTMNKRFLDTVVNHIKDKVELPAWSNVGMLGYYSLLRFEKKMPLSFSSNTAFIKEYILRMADDYVDRTAKNAFATVMGQTAKDFNWGGNANAANQGILLIRAYLISRNKKYVDYALTNLDYLLGRNATGYSFVTGIASKSPMHPHHRQSIADGVTDPVPGLLAGGPNPGMQDHCKYEFTEPETAYSDSDCSYASNEIAINWNAPIVYLSNALEALQGVVGYSKLK